MRERLTLPPQEGVVTDKGCDLTRADRVTNGRVDKVGEEGDTVLEVVVSNLHDTSGVLNNSNLGVEEHLSSTIKKTVDRNTSIRINDEDDLADANVAGSPSLRSLGENTGQGLLVKILFLGLVNHVSALSAVLGLNHVHKVLLDLLGDVQSVVHVGSLLELAGTDEALLAVVLRTSDPTNVVVVVELATPLDLLLRDTSPKTVIVHEDAGRSTVGLVVRDSSLQTPDGGDDDRIHTLLVDRHLDSDLGRNETLGVASSQVGLVAGVVARVGRSTTNRTNHLEQVAEDDLEEEQTDQDQERNGGDESHASPGVVQETFADQLADEDAKEQADGQSNGKTDEESGNEHDRSAERLGAIIGCILLENLIIDLVGEDSSRSLLQAGGSNSQAGHARGENGRRSGWHGEDVEGKSTLSPDQ